MDRTLVVEFPWITLASDKADPPNWEEVVSTDTRMLGTSGLAYVQESKIDLTGYTQSDLTVGFRRSFEQKGQYESISWDPTYNPVQDLIYQETIISSVPFNDDQLLGAVSSSPGFIPFNVANYDWGHFNRTQIIHGRKELQVANSTIGSDAFNAKGAAVLMNITDNYYSSLEPTAADCLYCYRVVIFPEPASLLGGIQQVQVAPKRVILDAFTVEEPELEYMMRLKRSYELANQV